MGFTVRRQFGVRLGSGGRKKGGGFNGDGGDDDGSTSETVAALER